MPERNVLKGICNECGSEIRLVLDGDVTDVESAREIAREALKKMNAFECPGHHMEICSPYPHYWNVDEWVLESSNVMTEEEFVSHLRSKFTEVLTTDEMIKRNVITSFAYGTPMTNDGIDWNFTSSPKGRRFYYH